MLRLVGIVLASLAALVVLVVAVGYCLPKSHVAARAILLKQKTADVFALISNFKDGASWRSNVRAVEMLPEADGRTRFREKTSDGSLIYEVIELNPPRRLVTEIADRNLPFGGRWIFEVSPKADGTQLNITERGEIYNPVFRVVSRFVIGYNRTLDAYLRNVNAKFGENAVPEPGSPAAQ
jgi:Polyketide cyclase / dehydrase and lipid transport